MSKNLASLIDEYITVLKTSELSPNTIKNKTSSLRLFLNWAKENDLDSDVSQLKGKQLREYFLYRQEQGTGKGIRRANHIHLKLFFEWVISEYKKEVKKNPLNKVHKPIYKAPVTEFPQVSIIDDMIDTCDSTFYGLRDRLLLLLYKQTGGRANEILHLIEYDFDEVEMIVNIRYGKGGKQRQVPYGEETAVALVLYKEARKEHMYAYLPELFVGRKGAFKYNGLRNMFAKRSRMVSDTVLKPHGFRHAFVHYAKTKGISEEALMELLGWSTRAMLDHYGRALRKERALDEYREKIQRKEE